MPLKLRKLTEDSIEGIKLIHNKFYGNDCRVDILDVNCSWVADENFESYVLMLPSSMRGDCDRFLVLYDGSLFRIDSNAVELKFSFQNFPSYFDHYRKSVISLLSDVFLLYGVFLIDPKGDSKDLVSIKAVKSNNRIWPVSKSNFLDDGFDFTAVL